MPDRSTSWRDAAAIDRGAVAPCWTVLMESKGWSAVFAHAAARPLAQPFFRALRVSGDCSKISGLAHAFRPYTWYLVFVKTERRL